jgi:murein DD-endopeptidase MepM/ murein hydrolase activator NlpD
MNKKTIFILAIAILAGVFFLAQNYSKENREISVKRETPSPQTQPETKVSQNKTETPIETKKPDFLPPLDQAKERVTKKYFGLFITPQNSPIQPEKFSGYHTGTDFEIFSGEENIDVPVKAVCSGKLLMKKSATGYGGVAVESCSLNGEPITVVYGHLKLANVAYNTGDKINAGETLGILGRGYSTETSGERKHLHLGFHKGVAVNILGYVQNKSELSDWLDPCQYACEN